MKVHNGITIKFDDRGYVSWMSAWERLPELLREGIVRIESPDGFVTDIYIN